jgi:ketosteroid isomerase-like protein
MTMIVRALATLLIGTSGLLTVASTRAHEPDAEEIALGSLVDAELAFARAGSEQGIRAAFLANFAADGVALEPAPVRVLEAWPARAAPTDPLAQHLDWKPAQAGVARSHDFGYTTGPYALWKASDPGRKQHGTFFSVWRRDRNGQWKVILDAGIRSPAAADFAALGAAPRPSFAGRGKATDARRELLAQEAAGFGSGASGLTPNAYAKLIADDVRLHRDGAAPIASRSAVAREVAQRMRRVVWMPIDARVARSSDMAVTYGRYRETYRASNTSDGYYAHLWLRDRAGRWRLAYDIALPGS